MSLSLGLAIASSAGDIAGQELTRSLTGIAEIILGAAEDIHIHKPAATALAHRVKETINVIVDAQTEGGHTIISPEWEAALNDFKSALIDIQHALDEIRKQSYLAQIIHRTHTATTIEDLSQRLKDAFAVLKIKLSIETDALSGNLVHAFQTLSLHTSTALAHIDLTSHHNSLPTAPALYLGRDTETQHIVDLLSGDTSAYIAVLGGPGMGKTTLAVAALHAPAVIGRFGSRRYYVACDAAEQQSSCFNIICSNFGIAFTSKSAAFNALEIVLHAGPSLLVLDNFESAWEAADSRMEAEEVLAFLAGIPTVSLVVTLRGLERPHGVAWTRPYLAPVLRLSNSAAWQLFVSTSDIAEDERDLLALLECTDNVPLALVLLAALAQSEPAERLLSQWEIQKTAMLSRSNGTTRLSSVDVSIQLSISSSRMQGCPSAVELLGLLSLLPNGAYPSDIFTWCNGISEARHAMATLLQTSLVYQQLDFKICVLAPIREFALRYNHPSQDALVPLYEHFFTLAQAVHEDGEGSSSPEAIAAVAPEIANIYSVIQHALDNTTISAKAVAAAVQLGYLLIDTGIGSLPLFSYAQDVATAAYLDDLMAELLYVSGHMAQRGAIPGNAVEIWSKAHNLFKQTNNRGGVIDTARALSNQAPADEALATCTNLVEMSKALGDSRRTAMCMFQLAYTHSRLENFTQAQLCYQQAINAASSKEKKLIGQALLNIGELKFYEGKIQEGMQEIQEAIPVLESVHRSTAIAQGCVVLAEVQLMQGCASEAIAHLQKAADLSLSLHDMWQASFASTSIIRAYLHIENTTSALNAANTLKSLIAPKGSIYKNNMLANLWISHSRIALAAGDIAAAEAFICSALTVQPSTDYPWSVATLYLQKIDALHQLGAIQQYMGDTEGAMTSYLTAALSWKHGSERLEMPISLSHLAEVVDDDVSELLLAAIMPVLLHYGLRPALARSLLHSASIAHRHNDINTAHHRASNALRYFEDIKYPREIARAKAFFETSM